MCISNSRDTGDQRITLLQCSKWKISRNGTLVKILEHSEEKFRFSAYNQSRRNGTLILLHLTNRNGVPVRSDPFRALGSLQSSEVHFEAGQSLRFSNSVTYFKGVLKCVTKCD